MEFKIYTWAVHFFLLLFLPPFFLGVIAKTKACFAGRKGPPLFQVYYDLYKLWSKGVVYSRSASYVLRMAAPIIFSVILLGGLLVPVVGASPIHFEGDFILLAYLFGVGRFFTILAAMDVGSSFEGMGAAREATFAALTELAFFLIVVSLVAMTHSTSLSGMLAWAKNHFLWAPAYLILAGAFFLILLTENSRMPIDDPTTHLELTMIHEVMILDYSGPDLGLILHGAAMKLFLFIALLTSLFWPPTETSFWLALGSSVLKMTGVAILIGVVESANARLRLIKIPQLLIANFVATAFALVIILMGKG